MSATTTAVAQIERTDSLLAELTQTANAITGPLSRTIPIADRDLDALAADVDAAFDQSLARASRQLAAAPSAARADESTREGASAAHFAALALAAIDAERQAFVQAIRTAATDASPFHASGMRSIELHARKVAGTILAQREILELARSQALRDVETMVACASAAALLVIAYLIRRPVLGAPALQRA